MEETGNTYIGTAKATTAFTRLTASRRSCGTSWPSATILMTSAAVLRPGVKYSLSLPAVAPFQSQTKAMSRSLIEVLPSILLVKEHTDDCHTAALGEETVEFKRSSK